MICDHIHIHRDGLHYDRCTREATHQVTYDMLSEKNVAQVCQWHAPRRLAARQPEYCQIQAIDVPQTQD